MIVDKKYFRFYQARWDLSGKIPALDPRQRSVKSRTKTGQIPAFCRASALVTQETVSKNTVNNQTASRFSLYNIMTSHKIHHNSFSEVIFWTMHHGIRLLTEIPGIYPNDMLDLRRSLANSIRREEQ